MTDLRYDCTLLPYVSVHAPVWVTRNTWRAWNRFKRRVWVIPRTLFFIFSKFIHTFLISIGCRFGGVYTTRLRAAREVPGSILTGSDVFLFCSFFLWCTWVIRHADHEFEGFRSVRCDATRELYVSKVVLWHE
jgi:hypothetical protein